MRELGGEVRRAFRPMPGGTNFSYVPESDATQLVTISGHPPEGELLSSIAHLLSDPGVLPRHPRILCDNRALRIVVSTPFIDEVLKLAQHHIDRLAGGRVALVAASTANFGMQRMFSMRADDLPFEVRAFHEIVEARDWLVPSSAVP